MLFCSIKASEHEYFFCFVFLCFFKFCIWIANFQTFLYLWNSWRPCNNHQYHYAIITDPIIRCCFLNFAITTKHTQQILTQQPVSCLSWAFSFCGHHWSPELPCPFPVAHWCGRGHRILHIYPSPVEDQDFFKKHFPLEYLISIPEILWFEYAGMCDKVFCLHQSHTRRQQSITTVFF